MMLEDIIIVVSLLMGEPRDTLPTKLARQDKFLACLLMPFHALLNLEKYN